MAKPKNKPAAQRSVPGTAPHRSPLLSYLCIFILTFILYSGTIGHGFVMDDGAVVTNHTTVQKGFSGITELFGQSSVYGSTKENFGSYRPLTMSLFAVEKQLFENNSTAFHFIQVLLYAVLCVVIYILLRKLFENYHPLLPVVSVVIFSVHPIHTEVVANIKSADEVLSLLFGSLAMLFAIRYVEKPRAALLVQGTIFFLASLFSKESAATFFLIIPLALYCFTASSQKQILTVAGAHASALLIYFLARNAALDQGPEGIALINNALSGAQSFSERYATTFVILFNYLKLLFFPHPLSWDYGYNQIPLVGFGDPVAIGSFLMYLVLGVFSLTAAIKPTIFKFSNSKILKLISFCILFFLISLSVSSNIFVLIGATMAERFLFTPSLGFCIAIGFIFLKLVGNKGNTGNTGNTKLTNLIATIPAKTLIPLLLIVILFTFKTVSRNSDWESNLTLFAKGTETCPNSYRTNTTFAWESILAGEKETDKEKKKAHVLNAVTYYKKGLAIYDGVEADWYNYGVSNSNLGNIEEAVKSYQRALEINSGHRNSNYNLGTVFMSRKDFPNALKYFLQLYRADSTFLDVPFKVGLSYQFMEDHRNAIPYYEVHFRRNPNDKNVITNLMLAHKALNDPERTNYYMRLLLRLNKK